MNHSFYSRRQKYLDYPIEVTIETTGKCNARCNFCPHEVLERKNHYMEEPLFRKIIEDLKIIPPSISFDISPFKVNEPLLDKKIFSRIKYITDELPNAGIRFFSNLNAAKKSDIINISKIERLRSLYISLNYINSDEYKKNMGLSLDKTLQNLKELLTLNANACFIPKITIGRVGDKTKNDEIFIMKVRELFNEWIDQIDIVVLDRVEWIDYLNLDKMIPYDTPCLRWFELSITCTGEVALCCMDGECKYSIGNLIKENAIDIYNKFEYKQYRLKILNRSKIKPCFGCSLL